MEDLSLHILDIVENSIRAGATEVLIRIIEDTEKNILSIEIEDNGSGMDKEELEKAADPFYTTKKGRRIGLGLSLLLQSAEECNGSLILRSDKGEGTYIKATFQYDHIDRKPLGDISKTLLTLIVGNPDMRLRYEHKKDGQGYIFDTLNIKEKFPDQPLNSPVLINFIKNDISEGLNKLNYMIK
jgi:hypothetical protein